MWKITYDWLEKEKVDIKSANWDDEKWDSVPKEDKVKIKLYDDDGALYYDGTYNDLNKSESKAFEPLDWAMDNAGCTYMKYKDPRTGKWETL